jgi:signal transduction histidine kinase
MSKAPSVDLLDAFEKAFPDTGFVLTETGEIVRTFVGPEIDVLLIEEIEKAVGQSVEDVFREQTSRKVQEQIERTLATQGLETSEYVIETEIGAHSFEARMAPVETDTVDPLVVALFRDVTARDLYAQRLDENNRVVSTIQESTQAVSRAQTVTDLYESICEVITTSSPYQFAWIGRYDEEANEVIPAAVGSGGSEYVAQLDLAVPGPDSDRTHPPAVAAVRQGSRQLIHSVYKSTSNGEWQTTALNEGFHSIAAFPIFNHNDGELTGVLNVYAQRPYAFGFNERELFEELCRDISLTEEALDTRATVKEQKDILESRNIEWEILNRIVRHDIRNKMAVSMGYAELLTDAVTGEQRDHLENVLHSTKQVIEITKEARDVAEALANSGEVELENIAVAPTLETALDEIKQTYPDATVTVDGALPTETVRANDFLGSVFRNVLSNAVIHNESAESRVTVSTTVTEDTVIVDIADNGPGIPDHIRESVSAPTQSIGDIDSMAGDAEGEGPENSGSASEHGVGLRLVCLLVDQYGGDIRFTDNDPEGTVVTIELGRG